MYKYIYLVFYYNYKCQNFYFAFLLAIGLVSATKVDKKFLDFQAFIAKYNKMYDTPEEMIEKFEVFKSNQKLIKKNSPKKFVYMSSLCYM